MDGIREVTEEFYGSSSSKKPFSSLEKLEFVRMPEWKQWHALDFPKLENLSIKNCAKLMGKLPENLCSLKELSISRCPELNLETSIQLSSLKSFGVFDCPKVEVRFDNAQLFTSQIVELSLHYCNSLTSLSFSILPSTLKKIMVLGCQKLKLDGPVGEMFLEEFWIQECDCIDDISPELLPRARRLVVIGCCSLTSFLIPIATEDLFIQNCENVEKLSLPCGNLPSAMTYLHICGSLKLKWLPERMHELLPSLEALQLENCPEIESFPQGGLPVNLQGLVIINCTKLLKGQKDWRLQRLRCLTELFIKNDGSDEEILACELPSFIQRLTIRNLKTLSLKNLTSLEHLRIADLPQIQSLAELHSLGLCHLTSLQSLDIENCCNLQSISESALPSSLSRLAIVKCPNLQSLTESPLPSSLSQLIIINCPNLQYLPVNGMPSSLSNLYIDNCPLLKSQLEFDKGEYWTNIAQIPVICIDWERL